MRTHVLLVVGILLAGCSGSDPTVGPSSTSDGGDDPPSFAGSSGGNQGGPSGTPSTSGGTGGNDAGLAQLPDDPGTYVPNAQNAFTGASPYRSNPPTMRANDMHSAPVTGKPCVQCHDGKTCVKFDFAGTVYQAPDLVDGAADVEIRIIDNNGYAYSVHSDVDGNFWHHKTADLALPALSGARTDSFTAIGHLNGPDCNTCHYQGNTKPTRLFVR